MSVENAKSQSTSKQISDSSSLSYPNTRREMSNMFNDNPNTSVAFRFKPVRMDVLLADLLEQSYSPTYEKGKMQHSHDEDEDENEDSFSGKDDNNGDDTLHWSNDSLLNDTSGINIIASSQDDSTDSATTSKAKSRIKISENKYSNNDILKNEYQMEINMNDIFKHSKPRKKDFYLSSKHHHVNDKYNDEFPTPFNFINDRKSSDTAKKSCSMPPKKELTASPPKSQVSSRLYSTRKIESVLTEKNLNVPEKEQVKSEYNLDNELKNSAENKMKRNIQYSLPMKKSAETPMRTMSKVSKSQDTPMRNVLEQMQPEMPMQSIRVTQPSMRSIQKVSDIAMRSTNEMRSMPKILETQMQSVPKLTDPPVRSTPRVQETPMRPVNKVPETPMRHTNKTAETPMRLMNKFSETPMKSIPKSTETPLRIQSRPYETPIHSQSRPTAPIRMQRSLDTPLVQLSGNSDSNFKTIRVKGIDFIVITKLGEGGSCQVFDCLDTKTLEHRAIKIVNLAVDAATANGYINEVKMLRTLQGNEYVIKMFDYEITKRTLFVILEKGGIDLSVFLRNIADKSARLPIHVINYYWMEMLNCVREIHNADIIHSDLKPSNFLIVDGRLKLIDFGIASRLSSDMTSVIKNVQVGTFNYISPEALLDSRGNESPGDGKLKIKISFKSDVWSLGCILYQLVYRKTPFHSIGNAYAKVSVIADPNHTIEYPKVEGIPSKTIDIIKKCLQYEIKRRPTVIDLISSYNAAIC